MALKTKSIIAINLAIIFACVLMGILGYMSAKNGFNTALEMKTESDIRALNEILNYRYSGDWHIENDILYKGDTKIDGADGIVDSLSKISDDKVIIFKGDTRVATNVTNEAGQRSVGTKASDEVIDKVLTHGESFIGTANVMGVEHHAAYAPLKSVSGQVIGMLFVGVSTRKNEIAEVTNSFIFSIIAAIAFVVVICVLASNFFISRVIEVINEIAKFTL